MKNAKAIIIIVVVVIGIVLAIYFSGKRAGKKTVPAPVPLPADTRGGSISPTFNPGPYTDPIWEDIDEIFGVHEAAPYVALNKLSNSELVAVYNDWNQRYFTKAGHKTMPQAIKGEYTFWNTQWATVAGLIVERYAAMGLS